MKEFYKEQIEKVAMEKIAARAWKKYFPQLSDANYKRLVNAGIYNKDKELKGLNRGTNAIMNKYDAKMVSKRNKATAAGVEMAKDDWLRKGDPLTVNEAEDMKKMLNKKNAYSVLPTLSQMHTFEPMNATGKSGGFAFVPKNSANKTIKSTSLQDEIKPVSRRDRDGRKWNQAITKRHEADEIRYGHINREKGIDNDTRYSSHVSPKVLIQESSHVAMMPREAKSDYFKKMRGITNETKQLEYMADTPYAGSGVYSKKDGRNSEKFIKGYNKWKAEQEAKK